MKRVVDPCQHVMSTQVVDGHGCGEHVDRHTCGDTQQTPTLGVFSPTTVKLQDLVSTKPTTRLLPRLQEEPEKV